MWSVDPTPCSHSAFVLCIDMYIDDKDALATVRLPWLGMQPPASTYAQLLDSLIALDAAATAVINCIDKRVASEREALAGLEKRLDAARTRMRAVAGSNAATVICSAPRYPAPKTSKPFERLFFDADKLMQQAVEAMTVPDEPPVESFAAMAERRRALDRAVRGTADTGATMGGTHGGRAAAAAAEESQQQRLRSALGDYEADIALRPELAANDPPPRGTPDALSPIPRYVSSTTSTILFNSRQTPYHDNSMVDNLSGEGSARLRESELGEKTKGISEAPQTVRFGDELPEVERIHYSYKPVRVECKLRTRPASVPHFPSLSSCWLVATAH